MEDRRGALISIANRPSTITPLPVEHPLSICAWLHCEATNEPSYFCTLSGEPMTKLATKRADHTPSSSRSSLNVTVPSRRC
ncbi:MAG: hypothetical protein DI536_30125 [Archangium gephyra]|uniref:Uncharacterized protein n=1 Tax=Archangium gephyra TaxID=48 RepID=A0A2W5SXZ2_9BACT|nr:MAG: hypothetical protein DI536_30125 [Archangium gephyra]